MEQFVVVGSPGNYVIKIAETEEEKELVEARRKEMEELRISYCKFEIERELFR